MTKRSIVCNRTLFAGALLALLSPAAALGQDIGPVAAAQINEILAAKAQFTAAQKKMDSALVFTAKSASGALAGKSFATAAPLLQVDPSGLVVVDIKGTVSDIVSQVTALG